MAEAISIDKIKEMYPDEWVLIGNPVYVDSSKLDLLFGVPIYHSKNKKEMFYEGRNMKEGFDRITWIYTGTFKARRVMTGIFGRVKK